ncbi:hypothetical protein FRC03_002673 [Tulasnella sp. 419]|nr:hypothetical protein FRC03_002673 [Tulasnella sp. 419]
MHDSKLPEYHFYKSLVDPNYRCPYADIPFEDEGDMSVYSTDSGEESERERTRKGTLGRIAKRRFETMLRSMTGRRGEIARCMAFSLEHADAVEDVADIITSSICVTNTPVPRKVARLHVICDILHNGAATIPNVWKFRQEFQLRLPDVFDHLSTIYHSFPGRITAETFKKQIVSVVEIWEDWIVFPHEFTTELRNRLDGVTTTGDAGGGSAGGGTKEKKSEDTKSTSQPSAPSKFTSGGFKPATEPVTAFDHKSATGIASGDDEAMSIDGDDVGDEDLDGMAVDGKGMDDDLDGGDLDGEYIST